MGNTDYYGEPAWLKSLEQERWVKVHAAIPDIIRMMQGNSLGGVNIPESHLRSRIQEYNELLSVREKFVKTLKRKYSLKKRSMYRLKIKNEL